MSARRPTKATSNWLAVHARFRPAAEALVDLGTGRRWTYARLYHESLCWTRRLSESGVGPGDRVAVLAQNRGETLALLFACAELGAILLPMNWRLAPPELAWQLDHCAAKLLLVDDPARVPPSAVPVLLLDDGPASTPMEGPGSALREPWMLMYTSGSTGRPKGACITHEQVHWNALNTILACDLTPADSTLTFTPLFHTGGMNSHTTPLLHRGGRVVLATGFVPAEALRTVSTERISLLMGVPTIFQMLADHPDFAGTDLSSVRDAIVGGSALPMPLLQRFLARGIPLRQGFGLTEVGPNCFSMPPDRIVEKQGTVGLPIPHVAARVVRPDGTDCAPDEPGELLLGGPAVCGGYWGDPEASQKAIVDGWFHTGDMLSKDADGFFTVRGRIKEMYKSGGENVYPPEVEAVIHACPGVAMAAVIGVPDEKWGEVGVAYVEPQPDVSLESTEILTYCQGRLARFKQPKKVVVTTLPRTASGKIDRIALRNLETT